ncbi:cytosolic 5'-nucleotidase 1B isoform X2 [Cyprinus carpio]|uniref:Cytosolic 5'-nucleotidase 1B isoform X2 n=1 Tax=Cyprinus carpio TaxID=7962 RepID=A0A9Q9VUX3_CYPCA|nr:cytosolic 5'-nucleotidase 1B isoform X2 [Cyprinus carpio]
MEDEKNRTGPLMIALQYNDLFDLDSISASTNTEDALPKGRAVAFVKAVQTVNERLVEQNKSESLLFEVILIAKECSEEIKMKIVESVKYYGLEIGKFFFFKKEELINTLQSNKVKLFLSTDRDDVCEALHTGIPAALLYEQSDDHVLSQLKVIFSDLHEGIRRSDRSDEEEVWAREQPSLHLCFNSMGLYKRLCVCPENSSGMGSGCGRGVLSGWSSLQPHTSCN